jgi:hypothetical protein
MLALPRPNWPDVLGTVDEAAWIADRDRKLSNALKLAVEIQAAYKYLKSQGAIFSATPSVLREHPFAARWYVSLAGYSQKTLQNIKEGPSSFGLTVRANTIVDRLCEQRAEYVVPGRHDENASRFCKWINEEILQKHPIAIRDEERALIVVSEILGGRIIGQGQNEGGDIAVVLVKELLVKHLAPAFPLEVKVEGVWEDFAPTHSIIDASLLRFGHLMVCDFTSGGNRPDLIVSISDEIVAVAEIKGRKDLSNVWESWMPQIATHMNDWAQKFRDASRLFFGTLIVEQMVDGFSTRGTRHIGFRELHADGRLTAVYNVGNVIAGQAGAVEAFRAFAAELARVLSSRRNSTRR